VEGDVVQAKDGDTVKVHYTGTLREGTVFDTTREGNPMEFKLGDGQVIPGFESAVRGMSPGEIRKVTILAEEAYGTRSEDLVVEIERDEFPSYLEPKVGQNLEILASGNHQMMVHVLRVSDSSVTLDGNHPLAGKDLNFEIELVEIHKG
jgi:peptidylprolyl isomerase